MNRSKDFLEFVSENPPPCMPDDKLFWFDEETGEIKQDHHCIGSLVLTENWEWKIIDDDSGELITPNENQYFCITPEEAKKFRDKVLGVKYAVLQPDEEGKIMVGTEPYSYLKASTLKDIASMGIHEDYFAAILRHDSEVKVGMVIFFEKNSYRVCEGGNVESCFIKSMDKKSKRILEDEFED